MLYKKKTDEKDHLSLEKHIIPVHITHHGMCGYCADCHTLGRGITR